MNNNDLKKEILMIRPRSPYDIADLISYLRRHEASVLVNMKDEKIDKEALESLFDCILTGTQPVMDIEIKTTGRPKVFICITQKKKI